MRPDLLFFRKGDLSDFLEQRKAALTKEIEERDSNYILNVSEQDFCQYLISKYSLEPPVVHESKINAYPPTEVEIDVSHEARRFIPDRSRPFYLKGVSVTIAVPFDGNGELFQYKPSMFTYNPPRGEIVGQEIHLIYESVEHDAEKLKQEYTRELGEIKRYLESIRKHIETFNNWLESSVRQIVAQRKKKLLDDQGLVSALGIPIKSRNDLPRTYTVPTIRRKLKIARPEATTKPFKPESTLSEQEYENILEIIYHMALVMERSPQTFSKLKEEEIRDHFLLHLNGHYEGQATGETFNYGGKTDILIRVEGKNIFIAECKFWKGQKGLLETVDQLLGYTSWRDTKTSILLFNKTREFSSVLDKIDSTMKTHGCYKREYKLKGTDLSNETTFSYVFHQPSDKNREIILTVMAFDIPS